MSFLLTHRSKPHSTTNLASYALFLKRYVHTLFDPLLPDVEGTVASKQADQKLHKHAKVRELYLEQKILVSYKCPGQVWIPGTAIERDRPLS